MSPGAILTLRRRLYVDSGVTTVGAGVSTGISQAGVDIVDSDTAGVLTVSCAVLLALTLQLLTRSSRVIWVCSFLS